VGDDGVKSGLCDFGEKTVAGGGVDEGGII